MYISYLPGKIVSSLESRTGWCSPSVCDTVYSYGSEYIRKYLNLWSCIELNRIKKGHTAKHEATGPSLGKWLAASDFRWTNPRMGSRSAPEWHMSPYPVQWVSWQRVQGWIEWLQMEWEKEKDPYSVWTQTQHPTIGWAILPKEQGFPGIGASFTGLAAHQFIFARFYISVITQFSWNI